MVTTNPAMIGAVLDSVLPKKLSANRIRLAKMPQMEKYLMTLRSVELMRKSLDVGQDGRDSR